MRMLDNVIDINFYTIPEARRSNLRHRPVGLGLMGFQDALQRAAASPYASDAAVAFADDSMEAIAYHAISASVDLAAERGRYPSLRRLAVEPRASCRSTRSSCWRKRAAGVDDGPLARRSTGTACASASDRPACATPT